MFKRSPWTYVIVELGGELLESQVLMGNIDEEGFEFGERGPLNWRGRCWSIPISCNRFDTRWRVGALPWSPGRGCGSALFWGADESPPGTSRLPGRPRVRYGRACLQAEEEWWLNVGWAAGQRLRRWPQLSQRPATVPPRRPGPGAGKRWPPLNSSNLIVMIRWQLSRLLLASGRQ